MGQMQSRKDGGGTPFPPSPMATPSPLAHTKVGGWRAGKSFSKGKINAGLQGDVLYHKTSSCSLYRPIGALSVGRGEMIERRQRSGLPLSISVAQV